MRRSINEFTNTAHVSIPKEHLSSHILQHNQTPKDLCMQFLSKMVISADRSSKYDLLLKLPQLWFVQHGCNISHNCI